MYSDTKNLFEYAVIENDIDTLTICAGCRDAHTTAQPNNNLEVEDHNDCYLQTAAAYPDKKIIVGGLIDDLVEDPTTELLVTSHCDICYCNREGNRWAAQAVPFSAQSVDQHQVAGTLHAELTQAQRISIENEQSVRDHYSSYYSEVLSNEAGVRCSGILSTETIREQRRASTGDLDRWAIDDQD
jgi:hypothetical protein